MVLKVHRPVFSDNSPGAFIDYVFNDWNGSSWRLRLSNDDARRLDVLYCNSICVVTTSSNTPHPNGKYIGFIHRV